MDELEAQLTVEWSAARAHLERAQTEIQSLQREVRVCIVQQNETIHHVCVQCICSVLLKNGDDYDMAYGSRMEKVHGIMYMAPRMRNI